MRTDRRIFHTKLYRFSKDGKQVWFIGSANASKAIQGDNHEMMLRLCGQHEALENYVEAVYNRSMPLDGTDSFASGETARNIADFFRNGRLVYNVRTEPNLYFVAIAIDQEKKALLRNMVAQNIPYSTLKAQGLSFDIGLALDITYEKNPSRASIRKYGIETSMGYWVPEYFIRTLEEKIDSGIKRREQKLDTINESLSSVSESELLHKLRSHVNAVSNIIQEKPNHEKIRERFKLFLSARRRQFSDEDAVKRLSQTYHIGAVPEIWSDPRSVESLLTVFFSDISRRLEGRPSPVIKPFRVSLGEYADPRSIRQWLEQRLESDGWLTSEWGKTTPNNGEDDFWE